MEDIGDEKEVEEVIEETSVVKTWFKVCLNTIVRKGVGLSSERLRILPMGSKVFVLEIQNRRARINNPIVGWCSIRSSNGDIILQKCVGDKGDSMHPPPTPKDGIDIDLVDEIERIYDEVHEDSQIPADVRVNLEDAFDVFKDAVLSKDHKHLADSLNELSKIFEQCGEQKESFLTERESELLELKNEAEKLRDHAFLQEQVHQRAQEELEQVREQMEGMLANEIQSENSTFFDEIELQDVVKLRGDQGLGIVRYRGPLNEEGDLYFGLELDSPQGNSNGSYKGIMLFEQPCKENHAKFYPLEQIERKIWPDDMLFQLHKILQANTQAETSRE